MAVKKCSIDHCYSSSSRHEDLGVTYHKFPKDPILCSAWVKVTHTKPTNNDNPAYVCSRHFCRSDFQVYQESKYVLKSGAIPSIFAWNMEDDKEIIKNDFEDIFENNHSDKVNTSNSSKESEVENLENIRRFIEQEQKQQQNSPQIISNVDNKCSDPFDTIALNTLDVIHKQQEPTVEKNIMNMILSETDVKLDEKKDEKVQTKPFISPDKGIVALTVGSKVEAKAFSGEWYPAEIVEVDYDEMEVLVHYENDSKKHDEWISVNSSRLRPYIPKTEKVEETEPQMVPPPVIIPEASQDKEESASKKKRETYAIGERCLARWRDNRRFLATICDDLGDGLYEVVFDDGFRLKLNSTRISKLKDTQVKQFTEQISVDTSMSPTTLSAVAPGIGPVASSSSPILNTPLYHTHLFDPTRDYLGSKSERREMKRKLNIKEIFNIGQKKRKINTPKEKSQPLEKKPRVAKKKWKKIKKLNVEIKQEVPDAVASIIGTVNAIKKEDTFQKSEVPQSSNVEESNDKITLEDLLDKNYTTDVAMNAMSDMSDASEFNSSTDPVSKEEEKLEKFEKPDESKHEEVLDKMKEVISKLEGGLNNIEKVDSPKTEIEPEVIKVDPINTEVDMNIAEVEPVNVETANVGDNVVDFTVKLEPEEPIQIDTVGTSSATLTTEGVKTETRPKKVPSKVKKTKKLRLLQEKKVKKQVEKVKNELEEMKRQVEEMRKAMLQKTEELSEQSRHAVEMPESFLLPGEWCCKWVDGEPVGRVQESDAEPKVDVNNKPALPRKSVIVEDKRLPQGWKKMMVRRSLGQSAGKWDVVLISPDNKRFHTKHEMRHYLDQNEGSLKQFERGLLDFGVHLKLSRRMGWVSYTGSAPLNPSPLVRKKKLSLKKDVKKKLKIRKPKAFQVKDEEIPQVEDESVLNETQFPTIEDGYVYVGALKVQVIDNLLRCPAEGCLKNFRNNTLIKMHIKHYHRELKKMLGATPKVLDLAYARTRPTAAEIKPKSESKVIKVKIPRPPKREEKTESKEPPPELRVNLTPLPPEAIPKQEDSPKLRQALVPKPVKRPKVLLPVRRPDPEPVPEVEEEVETYDVPQQIEVEDCVDFETAISTHTVTKPCEFFKKTEKKRKLFPKMAASEEDEWLTMNSDYETQSSFPGSCTPDSKTMEKVPTPNPAASSESNEEQKECEMYMYTETGERIKIEHMKREEIINCHCGFREEDGLMVQCELCLCWQHAMCHNIHKESEVPEKYTCSICLNPKRGRRSKRFIHDQDRLYEGLLPGAKPCEFLRRSHELSGNLLRIQDALHAMRVKYYVATKKDHPKLYLWAKDWENSEINLTQERLNSDYSDLNIIINNIGKENMPVKSQVDTLDDDGRVTPRDAAQLNLSGTFSGIVPLDFPITTSDLERMARTMQEQEPRVCAPQPEAAIENGACRERLLRHVQRCQALIDARLDSIEAQVAELESQDPSFEDDETADYFPRTKQTIQMLMRDLDTMEELGVVT
ncbi:PHD finger protein 20-like isoform X2 [Zerene cesonia]|uniref:PHD finger protein 20-like isoform X2 n=1 Tax=Zerene cesonia TaxID=33412 RepID=UPI0018E5486B|nr:PHD finger protein 20-like isoform X2 [Zerene cesonia]